MAHRRSPRSPIQSIIICVIIALAAVHRLPTAYAQLSACTQGEISLKTIAPFTIDDATSGNSYTFGFCSPTQPSPSLNYSDCSPPAGYVTQHTTATGACGVSLSVVRSGLTRIDANTSTFSVSDVGGSNVAVVTMVCDYTSTNGTTAALVGPVGIATSTAGVTTTSFTFSSRAACPYGTYFCDISRGVHCSPTYSCLFGICVDTSCTKMTLPYQPIQGQPADFISLASVTDCHGTPVSNLTRDYFTMTMGGRNVDDPVYFGESSMIFELAPPTTVTTMNPQITTLLLDQSNSVVGYYEDRLVEAAKNMTRDIMNANPNNYVAVILFDGAAKTYVLATHTTNQATVLAALDTLPIATTDLQSTNLYGAIMSGIQEAYRMKFSFAGVNMTNVFSSLVVFTDGYDTSAREERDAAIQQAAALGSDVTIMSIGIANTSDVQLLTTISNGYAAVADGVQGIAAAFDAITDRLISVSQNYYNLLFCVPMRSRNVTISIGLNRTTFPNAEPFVYYVDASQYTSGCNTTHLRQRMLNVPNYTSVVSTVLNASTSISNVIPPQGAFFFEWHFLEADTDTQIISVFPSPTDVYYIMESYDPTGGGRVVNGTTTLAPATTTIATTAVLTTTAGAGGSTPAPIPSTTVAPLPTPFNAPRCVLSPYCYDGMFNVSFVPLLGAKYRAFAVNNNVTNSSSLVLNGRRMQSAAVAADGSLMVTIAARNYVTTAPPATAGPTMTTWGPSFPIGPTDPPLTTPIPSTIPPKDFFTVYTDSEEDKGFSSDLDVPATVILLVFVLVYTILMLIFLFYRLCNDDDPARTRANGGVRRGGGGGGGYITNAPQLGIMMKEFNAPLVLKSESPDRDYFVVGGGNTSGNGSGAYHPDPRLEDNNLSSHGGIAMGGGHTAGFVQGSPYRHGGSVGGGGAYLPPPQQRVPSSSTPQHQNLQYSPIENSAAADRSSYGGPAGGGLPNPYRQQQQQQRPPATRGTSVASSYRPDYVVGAQPPPHHSAFGAVGPIPASQVGPYNNQQPNQRSNRSPSAVSFHQTVANGANPQHQQHHGTTFATVGVANPYRSGSNGAGNNQNGYYNTRAPSITFDQI